MDRWDGKKAKWENYVGQRCLIVRDSCLGSATEVLVLEVSPSGKRVKFRFLSGTEDWRDSGKWLLIELLKAKKLGGLK